MTRKIDFINGNTKKCLMAMVLPMIAAMFLNMAYNLVDSLWIGNLLGETAYAALTNSTPLILLLTSVAMGATNGISILLSQAIGSKDNKKIESLIATPNSTVLATNIFLVCAFAGTRTKQKVNGEISRKWLDRLGQAVFLSYALRKGQNFSGSLALTALFLRLQIE